METKPANETPGALERDPVCGMQVDPAKARARADHGGRTYFFCCEGCATRFRAAPDKYLAPPPKSAGPSLVVLTPGPVAKLPPPPPAAAPATAPGKADASVEYTCPMHPQIVAPGPGSCPICGMALEPKTISVEESPNEELISMTRRFWVGVALTLPVLLLAMGEMLGIVRGLSPRAIELIQLVLTTPVVLWAGWPFFERGWFSIVQLQHKMFKLIAIVTGTD